ncbi:hypothetical protein Leryth_008896 [Lithospermum erythrorhizon]|nr:hypothetical protein Leryth_008896 [Lithospermum erythrorhizon]
MDYFSLTIFSFTCILILQISQSSVASQSPLETYIVHVDMPANQILTESQDLETWYQSYLPTTLVNSNEESRMVYSYHNVFKGFAAKLTAEEVKDMEKMDGFLSATPQSVYQLHTTHSPSFLGLQKATGLWESSKYGEGIVVCVFDTGIKPDHPSFSDQGMSPPPATWKGECEFNSAACNNKLVGARSFSIGGGTPLDEDGHGTHTAGTAVGNFVSGASVYGLGKGVAAGIAPLAHLAVYKVCTFGCSESDILAGMDKAIDDGCNVLSMSLGAGPRPYYIDNIAIGAYKAMEKGIVVSCSAGNSGPYMATVANEAPWIMTVGASTIDRRFKAIVVLGNKVEFIGESAFQPGDINSSELSLVYPGRNTSISPFCSSSSLNGTDVRKKIVVCLVGGGVSRVGKGRAVKNAGGAAMIIVSSPSYANSTFAEAHVLPAAHVGYADGLKIINYIRSSSTPTASIMFNGTTIGDSRAPVMAAFSSRGPAPISPGLLKPDITAPGMNIVAAWPYSVENITNTKSTFNVLSGTSMSCPHISGVAALLKSAHPDWSPAAIKSAMMTTADVVNLGGNPIEDETFLPADIFATGAGHVNPSRANNPGLIYDLQPEDYIPFLCDVISYSIGGGSKPFSEDSLTIGAFRAAQKGIFVSCAAGNEGPYSSTLSNEAPWVLTVGASTIDRQLRATVVLGNRKEFEGQTAFQPNNFPRKRLPLVYPGAEDDEAVYCGCGSLNNTDVTGKIVVSYNAGNISRIEKGQTVKDAGGAAMILINVEDEGYTTMSDMHVIPASHVSFSAGQKIMAYLSSNSKPKATIKFKGTIVGVQNSPSITHFSSRGPNLASPGILKPDTVGPGLSILAAWPDLKNNTHTKSTFSMDTGTSMACPHLSGVAALLKRSHPDWSPAAIKSAIMTTADTLNRNGNQIMDERKKPANVFALGAGHVYPFSGNDPGLVYDIQPKDYIPYLCGLGYNDTQVRMIVQENVKCSTITSIPEAQLNYPSFSVKLHSGHKVYTRTVTNVGEANSTYGHVINNVPGVDIELSPTQLVFTKVNQKLTYQITFRRKSSTPAASSYVEGAIIWVSEHHDVRSPMSVQLEHLK